MNKQFKYIAIGCTVMGAIAAVLFQAPKEGKPENFKDTIGTRPAPMERASGQLKAQSTRADSLTPGTNEENAARSPKAETEVLPLNTHITTYQALSDEDLNQLTTDIEEAISTSGLMEKANDVGLNDDETGKLQELLTKAEALDMVKIERYLSRVENAFAKSDSATRGTKND